MEVSNIQAALSTSEMNLNIANDFDGTVNMSDISELEELINNYNASIAVTIALANSSFQTLTTIQDNINIILDNLTTLEQVGQVLVLNISALEQKIEENDVNVMNIQAIYNALRMNLSYLDTKANQLMYQLSALSIVVINTTSDLLSTTDRISLLAENVETKGQQVATNLVLSTNLNQTVRNAFNSVMDANERAQALLVC